MKALDLSSSTYGACLDGEFGESLAIRRLMRLIERRHRRCVITPTSGNVIEQRANISPSRRRAPLSEPGVPPTRAEGGEGARRLESQACDEAYWRKA